MLKSVPWVGLIIAAVLAWVGLAGGLQQGGEASQSQQVSDQADLRRAVEDHWQALASGQKYVALAWVEESSRNDFILRRELPIRSFHIDSISPQGSDEARVSVRVDAFLAGAAQPFSSLASQRWVRNEEGKWRLLYRPFTRQAYEAIFSPSVEPPEARGQLEVLPRQGLRIHAADPRRQGVLVIANGGSQAALLTDVVVDGELLQVVEAPQRIEPGERAALRLRLLVDAQQEMLPTNLLLVLRQGEEKKIFSVSVLCNYRSPAADKWLPPSSQPQDRP